MLFPSNLHAHTVFSDGKNTCEEMITRAIDIGFISIGLSDHSPAPYDECGIKPERYPYYLEEIQRLKGIYSGKIQLYAGLERDYYASLDPSGLDYVIGSCHYLRAPDGRYHSIDHRHQDFIEAIEAFGSAEAVVESYYSNVADIAISQKPDIIGHLDLVAKLNAEGGYFKESSPWYDRLTDTVCDYIAKSRSIVELNTSGIGRLGRAVPYPSPDIVAKLCRREVSMTISSDSHIKENLNLHFGEAIDILKYAGFNSVKILQNGRFDDMSL